VKRGLLSEEQSNILLERVEGFGKKLNAYINSIKNNHINLDQTVNPKLKTN
jgi:hypothetical protein